MRSPRGTTRTRSSRSSAPSASAQPTARSMADRLRWSRKPRHGTELLCEYVFRPAAHLVVLALAPLRVPPPAVVLAAGATGLVAAYGIGSGSLVAAALLLQLKTVLDNADGQLARADRAGVGAGALPRLRVGPPRRRGALRRARLGDRQVGARRSRFRVPDPRARRQLQRRAALPTRARRAVRGDARGDRAGRRPRPFLRPGVRAAGPAGRGLRGAASPRTRPGSAARRTTTVPPSRCSPTSA